MSAAAAARLRAAHYVAGAGDALARGRANALAGLAPAADAVAQLPELGAAESAPRVGELLRTLGVLDDLRALEAPLSQRACTELMRRQEEDGSWSDGAAVSPEERTFTTGMLAGYAAKTPFVRDSTLSAAADRLAVQWEPALVQGGAWAAIAAYAHCFSLVRHDAADGILQWCGRELERGYRTGAFDAVRTGRVFSLCRAHGMPGAQLGREDLVERLVADQLPDGGFQARDDGGTRARVAHTLDALAVLAHLAP